MSTSHITLRRGTDPESHLEDQIASAFGTPVFVYYSEVIRENYRLLSRLFPENGTIFYSLKANPNLSVAALLCQLGAGAEVSSLTELETARRAGFSPEQIIFVSPLKSDQEIEAAVTLQIKALVVDSFEELERLQRCALQKRISVSILLRVNPDFKLSDAPIRMGGVATQFGFSEKDIFGNPERFKKDYISILGMHVYNGSRVLKASVLVENVQKILELSGRVSRALNIPLCLLDVGGGFGIPYFKGEFPLDMRCLEDALPPLFAEHKRQHPFCQIITESGRFLVGTAGVLLSRIYAVKESHGQRFAVGDAGFNCFMAASGMGSSLVRNFPVRLVEDHNSVAQGEILEVQESGYHLTGPLCTPGDVLGRNLDGISVDLQAGALLALECAGAYGPSASPAYFIGHGYPAEVLVEGEKAFLVRQRDEPSDILRLQKNIYETRT